MLDAQNHEDIISYPNEEVIDNLTTPAESDTSIVSSVL